MKREGKLETAEFEVLNDGYELGCLPDLGDLPLEVQTGYGSDVWFICVVDEFGLKEDSQTEKQKGQRNKWRGSHDLYRSCVLKSFYIEELSISGLLF